VNDRIPKAEGLFRAAAQFQAASGEQEGPAATRAWWVILNASSRLALRCAEIDGDREAVEREGERLYRMLSAAGGVEEIAADEATKARERLS
jgi:hypothetical protein